MVGIRSLKLVGLLAVLFIAATSMGGVSGSLATIDDVFADFESGLSDGTDPDTNEPATGPSTESRSDARTDLNESNVELLVHRAINDYRVEAGKEPLEYDRALGEVADYHSGNMADDGRIYHVSPSGADFQDRYERFDYQCRVPAGGNRYYTGGENVAQTWFEVRLTTGDYYETEQELAAGLARQWYNSEGHRENMLKGEWRQQGIGIEVKRVDGNTAIYATQNFC